MVSALSLFGLGRLGLPLAALFARSALRTAGIDTDVALVDQLRAGKVPFEEPGLRELIAETYPTMTFSAEAHSAADTNASVVIVSTPSDPSHPELSCASVENVCRDLCAVLRERRYWRYHLIVISSTLMPGTISGKIVPLLEERLGRRSGKEFGVAYVPEFVALGGIISGFRNPAFLLVGSDDADSGAKAAALYGRIIKADTPIRFMSTNDAEFAKIALNVFLCIKISFGNSLAQLAERLGGADLNVIADTLGLDPRIGVGLLRGGGPYGGACLPRDVDAFLHLAQAVELKSPLVAASAKVNAAQYDLIEHQVISRHPRSVAVLGLSFKPGTPVTTGSPAFELIRRLQQRGIMVRAYDPLPMAREAARTAFGPAISCCDTLGEAVSRADLILVINADPAFLGVAADLPPDRWIVDPWGHVRGPHPGLIQLGRFSGSRTRPFTTVRQL